MLPPDGHVHTEWSWDAVAGSMERSCERAQALGLPSIAFTEHADFTDWTVGPERVAELPEHLRSRVAGGRLLPPALDLAGYLACVDRCRSRFPGLTILTGIEVGEPHWHADRVAGLLAAGPVDRLLGSLHSLPTGGRLRLVDDLYQTRPAAEVVRDYLAELLRMVEAGGEFAALAHIDYPVRYWPAAAGPYRPDELAGEHRAVLRALAGSGRALEVNTTVPLPEQVLRWWYEVGGEAVCFGSDAHEPSLVARGFAAAAALAEACGFRPGRHPYDFWRRAGR
jgi:histidinol-phosphatase (PHP family)